MMQMENSFSEKSLLMLPAIAPRDSIQIGGRNSLFGRRSPNNTCLPQARTPPRSWRWLPLSQPPGSLTSSCTEQSSTAYVGSNSKKTFTFSKHTESYQE